VGGREGGREVHSDACHVTDLPPSHAFYPAELLNSCARNVLAASYPRMPSTNLRHKRGCRSRDLCPSHACRLLICFINVIAILLICAIATQAAYQQPAAWFVSVIAILVICVHCHACDSLTCFISMIDIPVICVIATHAIY
jgi:hypothetical protein